MRYHTLRSLCALVILSASLFQSPVFADPGVDPCDSSLILFEEEFVRLRGRPALELRSIELPLGGQICVEAEAGGGLSSATVSLNSAAIFAPNDFPTSTPLTAVRELDAGAAELGITLRSRPGATLNLRFKLALPEGGFPVELLPVIGIERSILERRVLRDLEGVPDDEAQSGVDLRVAFHDVPSGGWHGSIFLTVERAEDDQLVAGESERFALPAGDSVFEMQLGVDGSALVPGYYKVEPIVFLGLGSHDVATAEEIPTLFLADPESRPAATFLTGPEEPVLVVDEGEAEIAAYRAAIASGNPDTVYKGMSALIGHYRLRGQYDLAELAVTGQTGQGFVTKDGDPMQRIFRFWNADDRRLAGDTEGAATLLETLIDEAPADASFLGEPFRGRALLKLGRLHASDRGFEAARDAYDRLIDDHPNLHASTALLERAAVHLRRGDLVSARADYQAMADLHHICTNPIIVKGTLPDDEPACPTEEQRHYADSKIELIDSDRAWFRDTPEEVVSGLQQAIEDRDITGFDALVSRVGFHYVLGAGEYRELSWEILSRPWFERLLTSPSELTLVAGYNEGTRQVVALQGLSAEAGAGDDGTVFLQLEESAFGWQWGGYNAVAVLGDESEGFDPCIVEPATTGCPGEPDPGPAAPPVSPAAPSNLAIEAPWAPGVHMRAGGLDGYFDYFTAGASALARFLVPVSTSPCGVSIPGYYYGFGTHDDPHNNYAIDYTQGWTGWCAFGVCVVPSHKQLGEVLQILDGHLLATPVETPAYGDPALAAHSGIVLQSIFDFSDGASDSSEANKVLLGVYQTQPSTSISNLLSTVQPCAVNPSATGCGLGDLLVNSEVDFFLRYMHLSKTCDGACPSVGMWIDRGTTIGMIDDTGKSLTSHLHFEVRRRPYTEPANDKLNWLSVRQRIGGKLYKEGDNGACIKSENDVAQDDTDFDGIFDRHDNCILVFNPDQLDIDGDHVGDVCDIDRDGDGTPNNLDGCPDEIANTDFDGDGLFDTCDPDSDDDGVPETEDQCPFFDDARDFDGDGRPDDCDPDADADGFLDRCDTVSFETCGCLADLDRFDPSTAGDHDGDGIDSLVDPCACRSGSTICRRYEDMVPEEVDLGTVTTGTWTEGFGGPGVEVP